MNSTDKRIEELLNRAGQTISDLPKGDGRHFIYDKELRKRADIVQMEWHGIKANRLVDVVDEVNMLLDYIMHLTDVIDRFEWALENVCNERDYLAYRLRRYRDCQSCERVNECERTPDHCLGWVFGGVPEDWSVDDE